jgi:hypothetical protein
MNPDYASVAERAGHRCEYCRAPEVVFNFPFEVEHVIPTSRGGQRDLTNLALACRSCNVRKGPFTRGAGELEARLSDPTRDAWHQHFHADVETGEIAGQTEIGGATVTRLGMNSATQMTARRQWMRLGLFP